MIHDINLSEFEINKLTKNYQTLYKYYDRICTINTYEIEIYNCLCSCNFILLLHKHNLEINNIQTLEYLITYYTQKKEMNKHVYK